MVRYLPFLFELALLLYALVDCIQTDARRVRNLPKLLWIVVVVLIPFAGPLAWLFAGRPPRGDAANWPVRTPPVSELPRQRPLAPDDDPEFLAKLKARTEHEDLLKKWEDDLKRREGELKRDPGADKRDSDADPKNPDADPKNSDADARNPDADARNPDADARNPDVDPKNPDATAS